MMSCIEEILKQWAQFPRLDNSFELGIWLYRRRDVVQCSSQAARYALSRKTWKLNLIICQNWIALWN
jgi:hypothetical protein